MNIWESGRIQVNEEINKTRTKRRNFRNRIDKKANKKRDGWIDRNDAIYAWTTYDKALSYSKFYQEPAIVEFDYSGEAWCIENYIIEDTFASNNIELEDINNIIKNSRRWNGVQNNNIEVWLKPSSVSEIYHVTDDYGNPL